MAMVILVNIGPGNVLLPDGTKPLPDPLLKISITKMPLKIMHFPGANELNQKDSERRGLTCAVQHWHHIHITTAILT